MKIPVYLFSGFLESGKTTFIQDILEDEEFNAGERTLLLICEEGIEEFSPEKFSGKNVFVEILKDKDKIEPRTLDWLTKKHRVERIMIEYNGMWLVENLLKSFPPDWDLAQEMTFFEERTFLNYNNNMRQLVYDKMRDADMIVFNRCNRDTIDKEALRTVVRGASGKARILYEYAFADVEEDDTPLELPFDKDAHVISIEDDWFAPWYRDINDNLEDYHGKRIIIKGRAVKDDTIPPEDFVFGRHLMTCCVDDISFAGVLARYVKGVAPVFNGNWYTLEGIIKVEHAEVYGQEPGPIIYAEKVTAAKEADPEVATF